MTQRTVAGATATGVGVGTLVGAALAPLGWFPVTCAAIAALAIGYAFVRAAFGARS